ncbi:MAG: hypothetical protein QOJ73_5427 [Streptosporangiaceae bacterium]|nr:hypothetical protein [Streptosporangiaceae bacterium]
MVRGPMIAEVTAGWRVTNAIAIWMRVIPADPLFGNNCARVIAACQPLFAAAQRAREVRDDLVLEQVLDMVIAIAAIHGDARYLEPILQAALDGLSPPTDVKPA